MDRALLMLLGLLAQQSPNALQEASALVEALDYSAALLVLKKTLKEKALPFPAQIKAHRLLATVHGARGETEQCQRAFFEVLRLDPNFELETNISPKISGAFEAALKTHRAARPQRLQVKATPSTQKISLLGNFKDKAQMIKKAKLRVSEDGGPFENHRAKLEHEQVSATIESSSARLRWYLSLEAASGASLLHWGTRNTPKTLTLSQPTTPWYKTWWFWSAATVVVLGAATTATVMTVQSNSRLGTIDVR